jgi:hypothetical protein
VSEPMDISFEVEELLRAVGIWSKDNVLKIVITPSEMTVETCALDEDGQKFIREDGFLATNSGTFRVLT